MIYLKMFRETAQCLIAAEADSEFEADQIIKHHIRNHEDEYQDYMGVTNKRIDEMWQMPFKDLEEYDDYRETVRDAGVAGEDTIEPLWILMKQKRDDDRCGCEKEQPKILCETTFGSGQTIEFKEFDGAFAFSRYIDELAKKYMLIAKPSEIAGCFRYLAIERS